MSSGPGVGNISQDGIQMSSNTMTDDQMRDALTFGEPTEAAEPVETTAPAVDPTAAPAVVDPAAPPADKVKSKSKDAAERINRATYEREQEKREAAAAKEDARRAREEAAQAKRELEEARRARTEPTREPARQAPVDTDPEPAFEDFEKDGPLQYEKWLQAQTRWGARQEYKQLRDREIQDRRAHERDRSLHEAHQRMGATVRDLMAEPEMAAALQTVMIPGDPTHPITAAIMQSEVQRELVSHLAQHPEELQRILAIPSKLAQYKAMTRLEARIEFSTAAPVAAPSGSAPARKTSNANPPINPVSGSHVSSGNGPPGDDEPFEAHEAYWNLKEREARGRK